MNRIIKAYDRNIVFQICKSAYHFSIPIVLPNGDEIYYNCEVKKDLPTEMVYKCSLVPKVVQLDLAEKSSPNDIVR